MNAVTTTELDAVPALLPLYAKAVALARSHRGDTLPDSRYAVAPQHIDPDRVADYRRVCGLEAADALPPAYLHVLAFPVSLALMTERRFPFPAVGLVHVANSITVLRPVHADEAIAFDLRVADLRPHAAGQQFDVLVEATVDGAPVWAERCTYLRRGAAAKRPPKDRESRTNAEPPGALALVRVPGDIGRRYGAVSGDRNPIHMLPLAARAFGFRTVIAHGMWLAARTLATLEGRVPDRYTIDIMFKTPVFVPATVAIRSAPSDAGWELDVRDAARGRPHLSATVMFR
jgi:acyl dehydratase